MRVGVHLRGVLVATYYDDRLTDAGTCSTFCGVLVGTITHGIQGRDLYVRGSVLVNEDELAVLMDALVNLCLVVPGTAELAV